MKRIGVLLLLLLASVPVFSAIRVRGGPTVPGALVDLTQEALVSVMGPRLKEGEELKALLVEEADRYLLTVEVDERKLVVPIPLSWEVEPGYIADSLIYDGLALLDDLPPLMIDVVSKTSVLVENPPSRIRVGDRFRAVDARGDEVGLLSVRRVDDSYLLLHQEGGKPLQVGMGLVPGPKIPVHLRASVDLRGVVGFHAGAALPLRIHPFSFAVEGGLSGGRELVMSVGIRSRISCSQIFGTGWALWRGLGFSANLLGGGAYRPDRGWGGYVQGIFLLEYVLGRWVVFAGGGERIRVFGSSVDDGLFFTAGTAYTF